MENTPANSQEFHEEITPRSISFVADPRYAGMYLKNVYESDEYFGQLGLLDQFQNSFLKLMASNPAYANLRTIDKTFLKVGDEVIYSTDHKRYIIISIAGEQTIIKRFGDRGEEQIDAPTDKLIPIDDVLVKIKSDVFANIYINIRKEVDINTCSEIDFFQCFCDYFRCNEKLLYNNLSLPIKDRLLRELDEKTGYLRRNKKTNY